MNDINLDNVFSVTLRDSGEVALINGDTKEIWGIVKTGYAVRISRVPRLQAAIGYVIGRDGRPRPDRHVVREAHDRRHTEGWSKRVRSIPRSSRVSKTSTPSSATTGRRSTSSPTAQR